MPWILAPLSEQLPLRLPLRLPVPRSESSRDSGADFDRKSMETTSSAAGGADSAMRRAEVTGKEEEEEEVGALVIGRGGDAR